MQISFSEWANIGLEYTRPGDNAISKLSLIQVLISLTVCYLNLDLTMALL